MEDYSDLTKKRLSTLLDALNSQRQIWELGGTVDMPDLNFLAGIVQALLHELVYGKREAGRDG